MAIEVEVIMDGSVNGNEFLKLGTPSDALHRSLSSSKRLMGIPSQTFPPTRGVQAARHARARDCSAIGTRAVGDDDAR